MDNREADSARGAGQNISDLMVAGQTPDMLILSNYDMNELKDLDLTFSLDEYIKKEKIDLNRFEPSTLEAIKMSTERTDLLALPYTRHFCALYYNKDIFDRFGMVSYPTWTEKPGIGLRLDEHTLSISKTSKYKDDTFKVLQVVNSDEVQMDLSRQGRISILKDQKIKDAYGADLDFMKGKNIGAAFKTTPAPGFVNTIYYNIARNEMVNAINDVVSKGTDINTALRNAEEKANNQIETKKAATK